jgi:hypothetical protein
MRRVRTFCSSALPLSCALFAATAGHAAPDAGAKASGNYNFYGHSAHHAFTSARSHVDTYQRYLSEAHAVPMPVRASAAPDSAPAPAVAAPTAPQGDTRIIAQAPVDPQIARESSDAIADDIERIQRHVSRMREQAKSLDDKAGLAELDDVERKLGGARRAHAALHAHHAGESIAPAEAMNLAQQVNEALRAAHAEHDEVMRRLATPPAAR